MPMDPQAKKHLDMMANVPPIYTVPLQDARRGLAAMMAQFRVAGEAQPVAGVEDRQVPVDGGTITVRIYTPAGEGPFPVFVYYHGGGFILGDLDMVDPPCRQVANGAGCLVVSVDYRLAPEYKFPTAVEDGYAAVKWVAGHASAFGGDPGRIAVGGDSAGANIATVAALMAWERGGPGIAAQVLVYPPVDFTAPQPELDPDMPGLLDRETAAYFDRMYFRDEADHASVYASPMFSSDLGRLPPALVLAAEFDPLCVQGAAYAAKLRAAGVPVEYKCYDGLIHGFFTMAGVIDRAGESIADVSAFLRKYF